MPGADAVLGVVQQDPAFGGMFFDDQGLLTMDVHESVLEMQSGFGRLAGIIARASRMPGDRRSS